MDPLLTERQAAILACVVDAYVETAQPVGSGTLSTAYDLGVSPATVRSEMARLESLGLLTHPHTSAGRVPTVAGYRYFVKHLMQSAELSEAEELTIRHQFHQAGANDERWMRLSAAVVAHTSGLAGLVAAERREDAPVVLYHAGLTHILSVPEFADNSRLRAIVEILEHGLGLAPVFERLPQRGVQVIIGGEPPLDALPDVSLVLSRFGAPADGARGVLGVVGPTRLSYDRAVPTVRFVASLVTELITANAA